MWRVIYAHFTQVETKLTPFIVDTVVNKIYRKIMQGILAYQTTRRKFYLNRKYSNLQKILPQSAASQISDLGLLNVKTGKLKIHPKIRKIFSKAKVWTDFNKRIKQDSYKKISYKPMQRRKKYKRIP